jgi:hypothetical protein
MREQSALVKRALLRIAAASGEQRVVAPRETVFASCFAYLGPFLRPELRSFSSAQCSEQVNFSHHFPLVPPFVAIL